ncbi:DNA repair protein rad32 [Wickerhamiella sorbophila]|uniref:Double-strand break repair protein n=1 Tax=Wickerhamiella sorbophila TaxID=45607 RepID=A0A2T0FGG1_9ASCO|nr:DNA repair protein rad32 [Wickerhamiella sorbophila]PRT54076.1 DNA repair protein rad32 [Wickerhamiella sorbophila]
MSSRFSVLVTTDNHVGYMENDAVRGDDAATTFREVMEIARDRQVDFVIQAGDLFHINKPTKRSMYHVIKTLRETCLGDKPVPFQVLHHGPLALEGDESLNHVNFADPNYNVAIPVFAISGNHDDSGGVGMLSPLDVLSASGLINHFGRVTDNDEITLEPILMQKGSTKIALYGLANVRDERLFRTFRAGNVRFLRPEVEPDTWFSILLVHQNRAAHSRTNYLPERFLPTFIDLVIWGHEHDCLIHPQTNPLTGFKVMQPGSSVATSMSEGEAEPKKVAILTVVDKEMDVETITLKTVRPMLIDTVVLATDTNIRPSRDSRQEVTRWLVEKVDGCIEQATSLWREANGPDSEPPLPLVRLRVDYSGGYDVENPTRISNRFVGKVANPNDVIQYTNKKSRPAEKSETPSLIPEAPAEEKIQLKELVHQFLAQQQMELLPEKGMEYAISQFIDKDEKQAFKALVDKTLIKRVEDLIGPIQEQSISPHPRKPTREIRSVLSTPTVTAEDDANARARTARHKAQLEISDDSDAMFVDSEDDEPAPRKPAKKTAPARSVRKAPVRKAAAKSKPVESTSLQDLDSDDGF